MNSTKLRSNEVTENIAEQLLQTIYPKLRDYKKDTNCGTSTQDFTKYYEEKEIDIEITDVINNDIPKFFAGNRNVKIKLNRLKYSYYLNIYSLPPNLRTLNNHVETFLISLEKIFLIMKKRAFNEYFIICISDLILKYDDQKFDLTGERFLLHAEIKEHHSEQLNIHYTLPPEDWRINDTIQKSITAINNKGRKRYFNGHSNLKWLVLMISGAQCSLLEHDKDEIEKFKKEFIKAINSASQTFKKPALKKQKDISIPKGISSYLSAEETNQITEFQKLANEFLKIFPMDREKEDVTLNKNQKIEHVFFIFYSIYNSEEKFIMNDSDVIKIPIRIPNVDVNSVKAKILIFDLKKNSFTSPNEVI